LLGASFGGQDSKQIVVFLCFASMIKSNLRMAEKIILESIITCPYCGFSKKEVMPVDSCQFFYECTNCRKLLKPLKGDCCVFCSYGNVKCPSVQLSGKCDDINIDQ